MRRLALLAALLSPATAPAAKVDTLFLWAVEYVESRGRNVTGDNGRAVGVMQLHEAAAIDAGLDPSLRHLEIRAREAAGRYLTELNELLRRAIGKEPTPGGLYCCYARGFAGFRRLGFRVSNCPSHVQKSAAIVNAIVGFTP